GITVGGGRVELSRLRARKLHQFAQRLDFQRRGGRNGKDDCGNACDRQQVALHVIWELLMLIRMHRKGSDGREQKRVVIVGGDEGGNRDQTVAARTIFHQHRLAPAGGQSVREQSRRNVRSAGGSEWHDEPDRPRRIDLRRRAHEALYIAEKGDGRKEKQPYHSNAPSQNPHSVASDDDSAVRPPFQTSQLRDQPAFCPTKSVSSLRVMSGANQTKSGANSKNEHASSGRPAATEWAVAIQPMIIGASEATPRPKVKDAPTPVPRIWVGKSSAI